MIGATGLPALSAAQKAEVIYTQARSELTNRLWRAALGGEEDGTKAIGGETKLPMSLDALLSLLDERKGATAHAAPQPPVPTVEKERNAPARWDGQGQQGQAPANGQRGYGPNAGYAGALSAAAQRTGLPAAALATIVHAEAAKGSDGRWLPYSRNPRSSAAGLGQFLSGTWRGEAEREGTWLNDVARQQGWLNDHGKVKGEDCAALLALRYNPEAAIQATADYAKANLDALGRAGISIGESAQAIAQAAYLGHHLGRGDAIRFLKGGLDPDRARTLLNVQVGAASAGKKIAATGNAAAAHRAWLLDFMGRNIRPERFDA
ncbi:peptidoglycan-binding protein [Sphingobium lactosutens]|uniref:peptidoglycan-binding protein n=1 Tax=Sphingobium lactosutens TaxID=522773 RepID=UPI0015BA86CC|nr:peptidoglycan-binding protein [Sphingobium lactosutens]NWK98908.1 peptidoglycan-binding protein [Sphingobium lactosutens]